MEMLLKNVLYVEDVSDEVSLDFILISNLYVFLKYFHETFKNMEM